MRRTLAVLVAAAALAPPAAASPPRVAAFFYPWYGTPALDGAWVKWNQNGTRPPARAATVFWPARGLYSSADRLVLAAQMRELRSARVDTVVSSWWGRGSPEAARLPAVAAAARRAGLRVAVHVEPYAGRTPSTVHADARALARLGVRDVFVYGAEDARPEEWARAADEGRAGVRLWAQTVLAGFAARGRFDGLYTYDVLAHGAWKFGRLCAQARRVRLLCSPSVGPGFDARRATPERRVKPRLRGRTYDSMWRAAVRARADTVTITSYNEWLEGTQIEPARARRGYASYDGAWGKRGRAAERAYLERTAWWSRRVAPRDRRSRGG